VIILLEREMGIGREVLTLQSYNMLTCTLLEQQLGQTDVERMGGKKEFEEFWSIKADRPTKSFQADR
jgi:hypothetical protein